MKRIDLHIHTNVSDGSSSIEEVMQDAKKADLAAIAIADHDCVDAVPRAMQLAPSYGIEVVSGVEFSSYINQQEVHVLGYLFDYQDASLLRILKELCEDRRERIKQIFSKLDDLGIVIDQHDRDCLHQSKSPGRLHVARLLCKKKIVRNIYEAFDQFLGNGKAAFVARKKMSVNEVAGIIRGAGGIPVLAHPASLIEKICIDELIDQGLLGLEVYHSTYPQRTVEKLIAIAEKRHLLLSGGSDCHGEARGKKVIGTVDVPYQLLERMKEKHINLKQLLSDEVINR